MALSVLLVSGLIGLVMYYGFATFWQKDVALVQLKNNSYIIGEIKKKEINFNNDLTVQLKTGNRDFYGVDFRWIKDSEIQSILIEERLKKNPSEIGSQIKELAIAYRKFLRRF